MCSIAKHTFYSVPATWACKLNKLPSQSKSCPPLALQVGTMYSPVHYWYLIFQHGEILELSFNPIFSIWIKTIFRNFRISWIF